MLVFDEAHLLEDLQKLERRSCAAFSAACAERLFPAYVAFSRAAGRGDVQSIAQMLECVWSDLVDEEIDLPRVQADLARCLELIPGEDEEPWIAEQPYADDAASAVAYTLRALQGGDPQDSAWAARRAYEALDHYVTHKLGLDDEDQVVRHPTLQAELLRQRRDLEELRLAGHDTTETLVRLRDRARAEAPGFFG